MAITVQPGLAGRMRAAAPVMLRVLSPEDPGRLAAALRPAREAIAGLGDGVYRYPYVTEPIPVPGGCVMLIDLTSMPDTLRATVPGLVTGSLRDGGIQDAEVGEAAEVGDRYTVFGSFGPVAQAWLGGARDRPMDHRVTARLDPGLVGIAAEWLRGEYRPGMETLALAISAEVPVTWDSIGPVARGILGTLSGAALLASDFGSAVASAVLGAFLGTGLALAAAGSGWPVPEVARHMRGQRDLIRAHLPGLAWAGVTAGSDTRYLLTARVTRSTPVPGPLWFQVLPPRYLDDLGGLPDGAVPLPGGAAELTVGEPEQWVPGHPDRRAVENQARRLLAGRQ